MTISIKPLKPISTIIEIRTKYWFDRNFGNIYSSGRGYVNLDYDNPICIPFQPGTPDYIKQLIKEKLIVAGINTRADDVIVFYSNEETLQRYVRQWVKTMDKINNLSLTELVVIALIHAVFIHILFGA